MADCGILDAPLLDSQPEASRLVTRQARWARHGDPAADREISITGASVAIEIACRSLVEAGKLRALPLRNRVAAVSVGMVAGEVLVDLDYVEDKDAEVDMNVVMTGKGDFVEVQGSGEETVFSQAQLEAMVAAAKTGIAKLLEIQNSALSTL